MTDERTPDEEAAERRADEAAEQGQPEQAPGRTPNPTTEDEAPAKPATKQTEGKPRNA